MEVGAIDRLPPLAPSARRRRPRARTVLLALGLAAIAAVVVRGDFTPSGAGDARAMVDARYAETAIEAYAADNGGSYSGATPARLDPLAAALSGEVEVDAGTSSYVITVRSTAGTGFRISRGEDGSTRLTCSPAGQGACPASGDWR